jgi:hypothetical protein
MMKKLQFWERCIESNQTEYFSNLHNFIIENQIKSDQNTKTNIIAHLRGLSLAFREYFPVLSDSNYWIKNPSDESTIFSSQGLSIEGADKLIEISSDYELKQRFRSLSLINFFPDREKRVPSAGRKGHYNVVTIFNYLSLRKSIFFLCKSENQAQKQTERRTGFKTIFLLWYRTTKHCADQNKRILHIKIFVEGSDRL